MAKALKTADYTELILLSYKLCGYDKKKHIKITSYIIESIKKVNLDDVYIEKIIMDCNMINNRSSFVLSKSQSKLINDLMEALNDEEYTTLVTEVYDILLRAYYV